MATLRSDIDDFTRRDLALLGKTKPVLTTGTVGPAVIIIHEVYGFTPTLARFCCWIRDAGFRVYAPVLFGSVDTNNPERIHLRITNAANLALAPLAPVSPEISAWPVRLSRTCLRPWSPSRACRRIGPRRSTCRHPTSPLSAVELKGRPPRARLPVRGRQILSGPSVLDD
jgi:hypothetical protein